MCTKWQSQTAFLVSWTFEFLVFLDCLHFFDFPKDGYLTMEPGKAHRAKAATDLEAYDHQQTGPITML